MIHAKALRSCRLKVGGEKGGVYSAGYAERTSCPLPGGEHFQDRSSDRSRIQVIRRPSTQPQAKKVEYLPTTETPA